MVHMRYNICTIVLLHLIVFNFIMPNEAFGLNPWKRYKSHKELQRQRKQTERDQFLIDFEERQLRHARLKKEAENIRFAVDMMSLGSTGLLLTGGMANLSLGMSMLSLKLLSMVDQYENDHSGTGFKAATALFFSGAAFCFDSRSMELSGGVILLFNQIMAL